MKSTLLVLSLALTTSLFTARAEEPAIEESTVFELRDTLELLTPTPHVVSAAFAELCVPHISGEVRNAGKDRAGPHASVAVNFYASSDGVAAMSSMHGAFSTGTVLLKEKLSPSSGEVTAVGGMVKRSAGFDPENGNWEYFYASKSGGFEIGRIPNCVSCHAKASSTDFVYSRKNGAQ
jgi:Cytochrome P460